MLGILHLRVYQIGVRLCGPDLSAKWSDHGNKFSILRKWFLEPRRDLQAVFTDDRQLYHKDHILKTTVWANRWNGYSINRLHGRTTSGHSILYDHGAKKATWRRSQTCHGCADVKDEGAQFFIAPPPSPSPPPKPGPPILGRKSEFGISSPYLSKCLQTAGRNGFQGFIMVGSQERASVLTCSLINFNHRSNITIINYCE